MSPLESFGTNLQKWGRRLGLLALISGCATDVRPEKATNPLADAFALMTYCRSAIIKGDTEHIIQIEATQRNLNVNMAKAQLWTESSCDPNAVSSAGAQGLMQLHPKYHKLQKPFDPQENIKEGLDEMERLKKKYNGDMELALAAYNAGEGSVAKYNGIPPFPETQAYIKRIFERKDLLDNLQKH